MDVDYETMVCTYKNNDIMEIRHLDNVLCYIYLFPFFAQLEITRAKIFNNNDIIIGDISTDWIQFVYGNSLKFKIRFLTKPVNFIKAKIDIDQKGKIEGRFQFSRNDLVLSIGTALDKANQHRYILEDHFGNELISIKHKLEISGFIANVMRSVYLLEAAAIVATIDYAVRFRPRPDTSASPVTV